MKICIDSPTAAERIQKELDRIQHRCTARTIDAAELLSAARNAVDYIPCSAAALDGAAVSVDPSAQAFPNAYRYIPESTVFYMINHRGKWSVTDIRRETCRRPTVAVHRRFPDTVKNAIIAALETDKL